MIVANGREYRRLSDELTVNGKKVYRAYANGELVYPDFDPDSIDYNRYPLLIRFKTSGSRAVTSSEEVLYTGNYVTYGFSGSYDAEVLIYSGGRLNRDGTYTRSSPYIIDYRGSYSAENTGLPFRSEKKQGRQIEWCVAAPCGPLSSSGTLNPMDEWGGNMVNYLPYYSAEVSPSDLGDDEYPFEQYDELMSDGPSDGTGGNASFQIDRLDWSTEKLRIALYMHTWCLVGYRMLYPDTGTTQYDSTIRGFGGYVSSNIDELLYEGYAKFAPEEMKAL